jgi:hypothetical protein
MAVSASAFQSPSYEMLPENTPHSAICREDVVLARKVLI